MATETASTVLNGYVALLLLCVVLTTLSHSAMAQCSAAESAVLLKFKSVLNGRGDLATWGPVGANCCSWKERKSMLEESRKQFLRMEKKVWTATHNDCIGPAF